MSEWEGIQGSGGWRKKLGDLLAEAEKAARSEDLGVRFGLSRRFNEFVEHSRPNDEEIRALDKIAGDAATDLMLLTIEERLKALVERSAEVARLTKEFEARAEAEAASARAIRLEKARQAALSLTQSVKALMDLRAALEEGKDDQLAGRLERLLKSIQDLRSLVERQA